MIRWLRKLISIRNLLVRRRAVVSPRARARRMAGQLATYMLLMIAGALTFTLAMAGLGNILNKVNVLDKVADNAALMLASRLANKSFQLYTALDNETEICKGTGFLGIIIIIVIIIVLIVITIVTYGGASPAWAALLSAVGPIAAATGIPAAVVATAALVVAGAAIGAAGGATGGAIDGSGAAQGALTGAQIGAAIGAGIGAGASAGAAIGSMGSVINSFAAALPAGTSAFVPSVTLGAIGALAGGAIAVASAGYNTYVANRLTQSAMSALQKATQGLGERRSIRESIFYFGLINTVDDPNMTRVPGSTIGGCHWTGNHDPLATREGDPEDIDGDGNTTESIPCFTVWWIKRMRELRRGHIQGVPLTQRVARFLRGGAGIDTPLEEMRCVVRRQYAYSKTNCATGIWDNSITCSPANSYCWGAFTRKMVEGSPGSRQLIERDAKHPLLDCISPNHPANHCHPPHNGRLIYVLDKLYNSGNPALKPSFYQPGPTVDQLKAWEAGNVGCTTHGCTSRALPPGFDEVDQMIWEMQDFVDVTKFLSTQKVDLLTLTVDEWLPWFYDGQPGGTDYYNLMYDSVDADGHQLGWVAKLNKWEKEINDVIKPNFPKCTWNAAHTEVTNPPCTGFKNGKQFWTVDADPDGDFGRLFNKDFPKFRNKIAKFRKRILDFYKDIQDLEQDAAEEWGGNGNIIGYHWEDARGPHWVEVRISDFMLARIKKSSGFLESCVKLKDYEDPMGARTWVRITRDSAPTRFGHLFTWNETRDESGDNDDGLGRPLGGLSKKSYAQYGMDQSQPPTLPPGCDINKPGCKINPDKWYVRLKAKQPI